MFVGKIKHLDQILKDDEPVKFSSSVKSNFIDDEIFKDAMDEIKKNKKNYKEKDEMTPFLKQLSKDAFNLYYKIRPEVYDKSNLQKSLHLNHDLLTRAIDNDDFERIRNNTCGDIFNSTLSLDLFQKEAIKYIEQWQNENAENKETMDKLNNVLEKQEQLNDLMDKANEEGNDQNLNKQIQKLMKEINKLNDDIDTDGDMSSLNAGLNNALKNIEKEVDDAEKVLQTFGMSNKGGSFDADTKNKSVPFQQKKKLVETLKSGWKFKEIMNQLGRMKEMVGKVGKKPTNYGQSICDIGIGNNISKVLSSEKIRLLDEDLEYDFYKKYINKNLLEYKMQGIEDGKGPIVVCLDISGSMDGESEIWAKAVAIASLQIASTQKRNYRCIAFNYRPEKIWDIDKPFYQCIDEVNEIANYGTFGGTSFESTLKEALKSVNESRYKKADILFITDGYPDYGLSDDFKKKFNLDKLNKGFTVQSILIGGESDTALRYLEEFSDTITPLKDLDKDGELANIFNNMKNK